MKTIGATIPIGVGDAIYIKAMLDAVKDNYSKISLKFHREIIQFYNLDEKYNLFLDDIGKLFFSEPPYMIDQESFDFEGIVDLCQKNNLQPVKPKLNHLLCKGNPLILDQEYVVLITKVRYMPRGEINARIPELTKLINDLSNKYKIVILGEKITEMNIGYKDLDINNIYQDYINNISNNVLDLTLPALGITSPNLIQLQQDCLIMSGAKLIITMGVGGGLSMATAVGNVVGYRVDNDPIANTVFKREYPDCIITKNWGHFLNSVRKYL
jgi:hypothetical protein